MSEPKKYPIKLSVLLVCYNQEKYIEQAVRSVLMQETDFDFEIVIGEDCSKDRTPQIVRRLAAENPGKIRAFCREKNLGMHDNHRATYWECRGQYIALLEGDDFWTDPRKLQKQVEFLEQHPECALCYHNVLIFDEHTNEEAFYCRPHQPTITETNDILQEIFVNTASVVMRNNLFPNFLETGKDLMMGDWSYYIWLSTFGKLGYIPEIMACYRQHRDGTWMSADVGARIHNVVKMYEQFDEFFEGKYHDAIQILKARYTAYYEMDGSRRKWKARAEKAEARVEELERSRRVLKMRQKEMEKELRELRSKSGATAAAR